MPSEAQNQSTNNPQPAADFLTVLESVGGGLATKKYTNLDANPRDYDNVKFFTPITLPVESLADLAGQLAILRQAPDACVIRGRLKDNVPPGPVLRRKNDRGGEPATFEPVAHLWVALDADKTSTPFDRLDPRGSVERWRATLPAGLRDAACIFHFSASQHREPNVRGRAWFWSERPLTDEEGKEWCRENGGGLDPAIFGTVQPIYTADPVFEGCADPLDRSLVLLPGGLARFELSPAALAKAHAPRRVVLEREAGEHPGLFYSLLEARGDILREAGEGKWIVTCPCEDEHSSPGGEGTVLWAAREGQTLGVIHCTHTSHGHDKFRHDDWLARFTANEIAAASALVPDLALRAAAVDLMTPIVAGLQADNDFALTEQGDADHFAREHGMRVRWVAGWDHYIGWNGQRWTLEGGEIIARQAWQDSLRGMLRSAAATGDETERKTLTGYARKRMSKKAEDATLGLARSRLVIEHRQLDADPWALNLANGTLDLHSMTLGAHDSARLCTKLAPVAWDERATCPRWLDFLQWAMCGDRELVTYLQRFFGLCLTGDASHEVLHVFHGDGGNGKTTAVVVFEGLLGDYAIRAPAKLLMAARHEAHPTEFADFAGRRLVTLAETREDQELDDQVLKLVASRDEIAARRMREDFWRFAPTHKSLLLTNHRPRVAGQDHGIWRRIVLVPWAATIDESKKDRDLPSKLKAELPGILAWAAQGLRDVLRDGLRPPQAVAKATEDYRTNEDAVARWIAAECDTGNDKSARARPLCEAFNAWAHGAREARLSERAFAARLARLGYQRSERNDANHWLGLCVRGHTVPALAAGIAGSQLPMMPTAAGARP
jgi:putative DNA primase/helicase